MINGVAGIVLFNPEIDRLKENIMAIYDQLDCIYLVDNGSSNIDAIKDLLPIIGNTKTVLIENGENLGIAHALNQICKLANKNSFEWVLTLDQDSICPFNLIKVYEQFIRLNDSGMLCPVLKDRNKENISHEKVVGKTTEVKECITSGSLIRLEAWEKSGKFDESMFIDGVDFDICHRITKVGYKILRVDEVHLLHEIGHITMRKFLFWDVVVKNHSAFRKYYIARNTIYLARKENRRLFKPILQNMKLLMIILFYENNKIEKLRAVLNGTKTGLSCEIMSSYQ